MAEQPKVFVITAVSSLGREIYETLIRPLFEDQLRWQCSHSHEFAGAGSTIGDLVARIAEADLVIIDLSALDADVFYSLGIAHTLSNRVLTLVSRSHETTPDLLKTHRVMAYENTVPGARQLEKEIKEAVRALPTWSARPSNPVRDVLPPQWFEHERDGQQDRVPATQAILDQQQKLEAALAQKVDQMQAQMLLKLDEMARAAGLQAGVVDISSLNKQLAELRAQLEEMSFKRNQAEDYLARLARDRDAVVRQMVTVARTLEADRVLLTSPRDAATQVFVAAALIVPGPPRASEPERLQAERFVKAFYIDVTPVTNAQFQRFVKATSYQTVAERENQTQGREDPTWRAPEGPGSSSAGREDHPVVWVYREDALAYATWAERRLPTRLEWERAMRGVDGQSWPWGEAWDPARCNLASHGTTPVAAYPTGISPAGCLDMVGNVWEWLADELPGGRLVLMGGSWGESLDTFKVGYKQLIVPSDGTDDATGFRCAMDVPESDSR